METKLEFTVKVVYGRSLLYPLNQQAKLACDLIGKKTLTPEQASILKAMGFEIQQVANELEIKPIK